MTPESDQWDDMIYLSNPDFCTTHESFQELHNEMNSLDQRNKGSSHLANAERDAKIARIVSRVLRAVHDIKPTESSPVSLVSRKVEAIEVLEHHVQPLSVSKPAVSGTSLPNKRLPHRASSLTLFEDSEEEKHPLGIILECDKCVLRESQIERDKAAILQQHEHELKNIYTMISSLRNILAEKLKLVEIEDETKELKPLTQQISGEIERMFTSLIKYKSIETCGKRITRENGYQTNVDVEVPNEAPAIRRNSGSEFDLLACINDSLKGLGSDWGFEYSAPSTNTAKDEITAEPASQDYTSVTTAYTHSNSFEQSIGYPDLPPKIYNDIQTLWLQQQSLKTSFRHTLFELEICTQDALKTMHSRFLKILSSIEPKSPQRVTLNKEKKQVQEMYTQIKEKLETFHHLVKEIKRDYLRIHVYQHEDDECHERILNDLKAVVVGIRTFQNKCMKHIQELQEMKQMWKQCWEAELQMVVSEQRFLKEVEAGVECVGVQELEDMLMQLKDLKMTDDGNGEDTYYRRMLGDTSREGEDDRESLFEEISVVLAMQNQNRMEALERAERVQRLKQECLALTQEKPFETELVAKVTQLLKQEL
ncbi:UNVERIFIED_CONTAM: hypothetical protein HDU68_009474 [Siphonaria sp. JEL0065]|nr:hypothetical protein HDU68_009474 [Siphonaria sp. JEL0065]